MKSGAARLSGLRQATRAAIIDITMRVVSLLPSATELLCAVGGEHLLVGRSHECDFPQTVAHLPVLTGQRIAASTSAEIDQQVRTALADEAVDSLYALDGELLATLRPDVILTQDLCEVCSIDLNTVRGLVREMKPQPHIVSLNPASVEDVFDDMLQVGEAVGLQSPAQTAVVGLRERFWSAQDYVAHHSDRPEVAFLEWMDPLFVGGHWTPQLIELAGGRHSLNPPGAKSKQVSPEDLAATLPDRLVICLCGYTLEDISRELGALTAQRWWSILPAVQANRVALVDGNQMFNRPGPRLVDALCWLVGWINDRAEVIPPGFPVLHPAHSCSARRPEC